MSVPINEVAHDRAPEQEPSLIGSAFRGLLKVAGFAAPIALFLAAQHTGLISAAGTGIANLYRGRMPEGAQKLISAQLAEHGRSAPAQTFFQALGNLRNNSRNYFNPTAGSEAPAPSPAV